MGDATWGVSGSVKPKGSDPYGVTTIGDATWGVSGSVEVLAMAPLLPCVSQQADELLPLLPPLMPFLRVGW